MWLELIRKYVTNNNFIVPQCGASLSKIQNAEKKLGVLFPQELKDLLLEVNGDQCLLLSTDQIIEDNDLIRKNLSECYDGLDALLFIAGNGCGDYYAYVIQDGKISTNQIVRWEHEINECVAVATGLVEMIEKYYRQGVQTRGTGELSVLY